MADMKKSRPGKSYCAAGGPGAINYANKTGTPGITMHYFRRTKLYGRSGLGLSEFTGKISFRQNSQRYVRRILMKRAFILRALLLWMRAETP